MCADRARSGPPPSTPSDPAADRTPVRRPRVSAATSRAFWSATLGDRPRIEPQTHDWLGRDTRGTISFAYAIPPAELFPLTEFRRATDKALLVRGRELLQLGPADGFEPLKIEVASRMDLESRQRLLDLAGEYGVPVVEDDICGDLRFDDADPLPTLRALDTRGLVLYMGSFSKTTFPGIRLGWIAAAAAVREHIVEIKQAVDLQTSGPTQAAMYEFARSGALERHIARVCIEYARRRDAMDAALRKHMPDECTWELPQGGLSLWVRFPDDVDADEIGRRALDAKVAVSSGRFFYPGRPREQAMRLAFASNPPNVVDEGIKRLATVVKSSIVRGDGPRPSKPRTRTALV